MKKTIRKILCAVLAFAMIFAAIPAFAAEINDVALWDGGCIDFSCYDEYLYGGEITLGDNPINAEVDGEYSFLRFYEFNVPETGYYRISNYIGFGKIDSEGIIHDANYPYTSCYDDGYFYVVYLEKGNVVAGYMFEEHNSTTLEIDYIDDEIEEIVFDKSIIADRIYNSDFYLNDSNEFDFYDIDYSVVFSNGEKFEFEDVYLSFRMKDEPVNGKNTVYATFAGFEQEETATFYYIDYLVESVELSNVDYYLDAFEFYNGRYSFVDYYDEEITVNYTDGTSETFVYGYDEEAGQKREITLFGNEYHVGIYHSELDLTLDVHIADHVFATYDCTPVKTNRISNYDYLIRNLKGDFEVFTNCMEYYWDGIVHPEHMEHFIFSFRLFIGNFTRLNKMAKEIDSYIRFVYL